MPKRYLALLVGAFVLVPQWDSAHAQMDFSLDETEGAEGDEPIPEDIPEEDDEGSSGSGGSLSDWGEPEASTSSETAAEDTEERPAEAVEEIYAVQQIYALRLNRFELAPSAAFVVNDPYVSHPAVGVAMNYWISNVLAVGANFLWYQFIDSNESDLNFFLRRSTRLAVPITEWQMGMHLNFTYVPFYGKFNMFREFIFQYDAYIVGGVGLMRTRPVPVIDQAVREFDYDWRVAFNIGLGIRIFLTRYLAVFTEFRNYMYLERYENLDVALGEARNDRSTWLADGNTFTNATTVQVGLTVFFPFSVEYRLPK
ncbi:MAG: outer membrane beta-barrel domain-containing protein [Polyangiales bacterium]|nr:outer membrane beta-barrel domain-containing protein [Myxococcales bacterium]MCB9659183.1 outer membrane beta-barrel domain-containing protein [Sandaracinaceae bacterium]